MSRQHTLLFSFIVLILASLACNAFAPDPEPGAALPPPSVEDLTATAVPTSSGLAPTATLPGQEPGQEGTVDGSNGQPTVRVLVDLNIRRGPGVQYGRVGFLLANETAPILGRDPATGWWKIICPPTVDEITECWISGGAQYSSATNADNVPVAIAPPTPTPVPTQAPTTEPTTAAGTNNIVTSSEFIIFTTADGLYYAPITNAEVPAAMGERVQLIANPLVERVQISPNGKLVAYTTVIDGDHQLRLLTISDQNDTLLVNASTLDDAPNDALTIGLGDVEWLANSQGLLFNTQMQEQGPGVVAMENLLRVSLGGDIVELLGEGEFAQEFEIRGDQVIGGSSDRVVSTTTSGTPAITLFEFPMVNTASEYIFYPNAQWIDGNTAYVAVPDADPFANQQFSVWQVSTNGTAVQGPELPGLGLFDSVRWSPNGSRLVFIDTVTESGTSILNLANGDGSDVDEYDRGTNMQIYSWQPNSQGWLYSTSSYYAYGSEGGAPVEFLPAGNVIDMQWLNGDVFVTAVGLRGQWSLLSNDRSGNSNTLTIANVDFVNFDVWSP